VSDAADRIAWRTLADADRTALREAAQGVFGPLPWVRLAYHHGSTAADGAPGRDVDVALVADPVAGPSELAMIDRLAADLAARTGIHDVPFDVRVVRGASPVFLGQLMRTGRLLFERSVADRVEFEAYANSLWLDFQPVWERMRRSARG
jgi:hypothetical protein